VRLALVQIINQSKVQRGTLEQADQRYRQQKSGSNFNDGIVLLLRKSTG